MPKPNRGNTIKLSIRLSTRARHIKENGEVGGTIIKAAENLGTSSAGVILFALTKILKNPPSVSEIEQLEQEITLERDHFVLSINEGLSEKINELSEDYDMKKNRLVGYLVSQYFESVEEPEQKEGTDPRKFMIQVNENLKKKMMKYSEEHFVPLSAIISYSILNGPYEGLPTYEEGESVQVFTNIPAYILEIVKSEAHDRNIREHFYTSLCLYKQFMTEEGRFFE